VLEKIFTTVGVAGFLALFQATGAGFIRGSWSLITEARRQSKYGQLAGGIGIGLFGSAWSLFPIVIASGISGLTGGIAQSVILGVLLWSVFAPLREAAVEEKVATGAPAPRGEQPPAAAGPLPGAGSLRNRLLPALTTLLIALAYLLTLWGIALPGVSGEWLSLLVKVEFLVIHSFPFLALITLPRLKWRRWRIFQWFLFVTWMCLYLAFAVADESGLAGIAAFLVATAGTYLGFLLRWTDIRRIAALAKRWLVSFILFMAAAGIAGSEDWRFSRALLLHGLIYFAAVGLMELSGLYDRDWLRPFRRSLADRTPLSGA
jgi:hypothetical protein